MLLTPDDIEAIDLAFRTIDSFHTEAADIVPDDYELELSVTVTSNPDKHRHLGTIVYDGPSESYRFEVNDG